MPTTRASRIHSSVRVDRSSERAVGVCGDRDSGNDKVTSANVDRLESLFTRDNHRFIVTQIQKTRSSGGVSTMHASACLQLATEYGLISTFAYVHTIFFGLDVHGSMLCASLVRRVVSRMTSYSTNVAFCSYRIASVRDGRVVAP